MARFKLSCQITVSASTVVEADTLEEAIAIGEGREAVIGGLHSGANENESWVIEDADGAVVNVHEE